MRNDIKRIDIFSALADGDLDALAAKMQERSFRKGEVLFREGEAGSELFAITSGKVAITIQGQDGDAIELSRLGGGAFFGEMSIIDGTARSATCTALETTRCLILAAADFEALIGEQPTAAVAVLDRMLDVTTGRLLSTGAFLTQMVQWGDTAKKRAITDAATGLFNRRYLEDSFEGLLTQARRTKTPLSYAMFDLDRFGKLNAEYGAVFCDNVILTIADVFRAVFSESDILVRYGGDEFCFLMPEAAEGASKKCESVCAALRALTFPGHPDLRISCSIGVADFPAVAKNSRYLKEKADKALYLAKEAGRDRVMVWDQTQEEGTKHELSTIAQKNRLVENFVRTLTSKDSFLILGHRDPDEDCVSAMVAFALLVSKFNKKAVLAFGGPVQDNFEYLLKICRYNSIEIIDGNRAPPECQVLALIDTAKPELIERGDIWESLKDRASVQKLEIDHHLGADSQYMGDIGYRMVYEASSSCEIIGYLALKLEEHRELLGSYQIQEILSRNIVLAVLSGIIGDTQMGRYIETRRERWFYRRFSSMFERLLAEKTHHDSQNFSNRQQVFDALANLSVDEEACYRFISANIKTQGAIRYVVLDAAASHHLFTTWGVETAVAVTKAVANQLAEESGKLGLVGYYDEPEVSPFAQFRLRRSQAWSGIDLRETLEELGIENGGGHPGAVGFRIEREYLLDIEAAADSIVKQVDEMVSQSLSSV